eukprot:TRINITY_DN10846_c0_g1_i2.p1 TRINITY_DN10846_c0_g1~~TRINITY_DN10846_c0_g1_i2.p1  ORF type:complete len:198 (-),score=55.97 TRINITY_DN10846_c0_g1_i2:7-540(-)
MGDDCFSELKANDKKNVIFTIFILAGLIIFFAGFSKFNNGAKSVNVDLPLVSLIIYILGGVLPFVYASLTVCCSGARAPGWLCCGFVLWVVALALCGLTFAAFTLGLDAVLKSGGLCDSSNTQYPAYKAYCDDVVNGINVAFAGGAIELFFLLCMLVATCIRRGELNNQRPQGILMM